MSIDLRLGGAVVAAADELARELTSGEAAADVEHHPAKGKNEEQYVITIAVHYLEPPDGGSGVTKDVVITVPIDVAPEFAAKITALCAIPNAKQAPTVHSIGEATG